MDRRVLIIIVSAIGALGSMMGYVFGPNFNMLLATAFVVGGMSNPLYSLLIAHTNDFLEHEDMAAASGGMIFINGLGAIFGPLIVGAWMESTDPSAFYLFTGVLFVILAAYALYRATRRGARTVEDTGVYVAIGQGYATPYSMEIAQEYAISSEQSGEDGDKAA